MRRVELWHLRIFNSPTNAYTMDLGLELRARLYQPFHNVRNGFDIFAQREEASRASKMISRAILNALINAKKLLIKNPFDNW